nr:unnamed protein product [Digitaria exilis]
MNVEQERNLINLLEAGKPSPTKRSASTWDLAIEVQLMRLLAAGLLLPLGRSPFEAAATADALARST